MKFKRETQLPYPQPWEWVRDNIYFEDDKLFFVAVGAHDGVSSSNTGHFEIDLEWNGICIEPNPQVFEQLKKNRKCKLYNCCVGSSNDEVNFLLISGYAEMLKHGLIQDIDYWHKLIDYKSITTDQILTYIKYSVNIKQNVVSQDPT